MSGKTLYTYLEAEAIENDYDQQVPLAVIAEHVNKDFHEGKPVRSINSVKYVIRQIYHGDGWYERLEEKWLSNIGEEPTQ